MTGRAEVGRVVLRPPPDDSDSSRGWQIIGATFLVVVIAVFVPPNIIYDGAQQHACLYYYGIALLGCCVTYPLYQILSSRFHRRHFVEGSIEITPNGVQLMSTYGVSSCSSSTVSTSSTSSLSPQSISDDSQEHIRQYQQKYRLRRPSILTFKKNEYNPSNDVNSDIVKHQHHVHKVIHAQIPHSQIIDIIVMEIVWPHCVWSQVAFRLRSTVTTSNRMSDDDDDGGKGNDVISVVGDDWSNNLDGSQTKGLEKYEIRQLPPGNKNKHIDNNHDKKSQRHPSSPLPLSSPSESKIAQLQNGEVSIIPAFSPKDCHGMLTYEECLFVQAEIEKLLGIIR